MILDEIARVSTTLYISREKNTCQSDKPSLSYYHLLPFQYDATGERPVSVSQSNADQAMSKEVCKVAAVEHGHR